MRDNKLGKIESMILFVVSVIERFIKTQKQRMITYTRVARGDHHLKHLEDTNYPMDRFCLALDNYFTLPKVIAALREKGIGIVGTARFRRGWPPAKLANISQDKVAFNDFYYCLDQYGTLCARWMDNGLVFCCSTLHHVGDSISRRRKRPRVTNKNKNHVNTIWGEESVKKINIPKLIDDYNHWMGGVDLCDQRIAYYHPDLRCQRNWVPMFLQIMSIIRNNAFIVYKENFKKDAKSHKEFTLDMIDALMLDARNNFIPYNEDEKKPQAIPHHTHKKNHVLQINMFQSATVFLVVFRLIILRGNSQIEL